MSAEDFNFQVQFLTDLPGSQWLAFSVESITSSVAECGATRDSVAATLPCSAPLTRADLLATPPLARDNEGATFPSQYCSATPLWQWKAYTNRTRWSDATPLGARLCGWWSTKLTRAFSQWMPCPLPVKKARTYIFTDSYFVAAPSLKSAPSFDLHSDHGEYLSAPKSQRFLRFAIAMPIADPRNR